MKILYKIRCLLHSKKHFSAENSRQLMMLREVTTLYFKGNEKDPNKLCEQNTEILSVEGYIPLRFKCLMTQYSLRIKRIGNVQHKNRISKIFKVFKITCIYIYTHIHIYIYI